jgi:hypothetical protein
MGLAAQVRARRGQVPLVLAMIVLTCVALGLLRSG